MMHQKKPLMSHRKTYHLCIDRCSNNTSFWMYLRCLADASRVLALRYSNYASKKARVSMEISTEGNKLYHTVQANTTSFYVEGLRCSCEDVFLLLFFWTINNKTIRATLSSKFASEHSLGGSNEELFDKFKEDQTANKM